MNFEMIKDFTENFIEEIKVNLILIWIIVSSLIKSLSLTSICIGVIFGFLYLLELMINLILK